MKSFYVALMMSLLQLSIYAQTTDEVTILSPKASSIMKFGVYPVSLYTGLIDITVPVYTIEGNGIKVPIEFKYHASGLKYDDVSNEVGLGWTLMAGGVITQTFRGAPDGQFETYSRDITKIKTCDDASPLDNDYVRLRKVEKGTRSDNPEPSSEKMDGEFDMYSFSFLNHSGNFCFPFLGSEVNGFAPSTGLFIPANGMKVIDRSSGLKLEILDTEGIFYRFEVKDVDFNKNFREYYLTKIISANKADTINFYYDVIPRLSIFTMRPYIDSEVIVTTTSTIRRDLDSEGTILTYTGGVNYEYLRPPRLTRIDFRGGYISFEYATVNNVTAWDLQQIKVFSSTKDLPLQTILLTKSLFSIGEKRLDKVTFSNLQGQSYDYQFGYKGEPLKTYPTTNEIRQGIDYWGYFNGSSVPYGQRFVPRFDNMPSGMQGTDRNASDYYMQMGILNKIIYPTKGYSEFTYEAHQARYSLGTPIITCGGVRIKEIKNYLPDGSLAEKKWYKYGINESGTGIANTYPDIKDFISESRVLITHAENSLERGDIPIHLCVLKEIKRYASFPKISYFLSGSSVVYPQVTEYTGINTEDIGKTVYSYEVVTDEKIDEYGGGNTYRWNSPNSYLRTYQWETGNLLSKETFKKQGSIYQKVYSIENQYHNINELEFMNVRVLPYVGFEYAWIGENVRYTIPDINSSFCSFPEYRYYFGGNNPAVMCPYDYFNYYTTTGLRVLSSTKQTTDGVSTYTSYDSYNENGLPTSITHTSSKEDNFTTMFKYPTDFTIAPYIGMQSANILTPVIEKASYKNGNFLKKEILSYGEFSNFFAPKKYEEAYRTETPILKKTYDYDIRANLQELSNNDETEVYLWGYNSRYPIARIQNVTY